MFERFQILFQRYSRYLIYGAIAAIIWAGLWVLLGIYLSWDRKPSKDLPYYISQGIIFARAINIVSLVLGGSLGLTVAVSGWSKNKIQNAWILGFVFMHTALTVLNFMIRI